MGEGARFSLGLQAGERTGLGEVARREMGEDCPNESVQGDVARRTGVGARPNLGLVAGDSASASSWLLVGIRIGGAVTLRLRNPTQNDETSDCFGVVHCGEFGIECGELGTSVSELVAVLRKCELEKEELVSVSDDGEPDARQDGASKFLMLHELSVIDDSPIIPFSDSEASLKMIDADEVRGLSCDRLSGEASDEKALSVEVVIVIVVGVA